MSFYEDKTSEDEGFYEMELHDQFHASGRIPGQKFSNQGSEESSRHAVISRRISERRNELICEEEQLTDSLNLEQLTNAYNRLMK